MSGRAVALVCALLFASACTSEPRVATSSLPEVALPDLSRMEPAVRQQLSDSYASLASKPGDSNAYGQLGNLLLAAEYFDAAEACYLHAEALAPNEMRWPY